MDDDDTNVDDDDTYVVLTMYQTYYNHFYVLSL